MIWEYSFKYNTSGGPWSQKKEALSIEIHIACQVWNLKSLSLILFPISNHIHHDDNDNLIIFFQIQDILRTLKSKEGRYGSLNFTKHVTFEIQSPYLSSYSPFLIILIIEVMMIWEYSFKSRYHYQHVMFEIWMPFKHLITPFNCIHHELNDVMLWMLDALLSLNSSLDYIFEFSLKWYRVCRF